MQTSKSRLNASSKSKTNGLSLANISITSLVERVLLSINLN